MQSTRDLLLKLARDEGWNDRGLHLATVKAVEAAKSSCELELEGQAGFPEARLRAALDSSPLGLRLLPAEDSTVLVAVPDDDDTRAFILQYTELQAVELEFDKGHFLKVSKDGTAELQADSITLRGGGLGGLIKIADLVSKLNALEQFAVDAQLFMQTHGHPYVSPGGPATSSPSLDPVPTAPAQTQKADLENPKITHG